MKQFWKQKQYLLAIFPQLLSHGLHTWICSIGKVQFIFTVKDVEINVQRYQLNVL